jgi:hypothetical protein
MIVPVRLREFEQFSSSPGGRKINTREDAELPLRVLFMTGPGRKFGANFSVFALLSTVSPVEEYSLFWFQQPRGNWLESNNDTNHRPIATNRLAEFAKIVPVGYAASTMWIGIPTA